MKHDDQLIEKVIKQLMRDWDDENYPDHRDIARWLIEQIPSDKIEEYMTGVEE